MRRRLRKKLCKGEFDVPVIPIAFLIASIPERNVLLDRFIEEAIEANGLQFGGGGASDVWSGFAEPYARSLSITGEQRSTIVAWLASQQDIVDYFVGDIVRGSELEPVLAGEPDFPRTRLAPSGT